jgi:hypothetical protein
MPQRPEHSIWIEIAWDVLCWVASLLWAVFRWVASLLWAALKLPWRVLGAILRWCEGLDYEAVFVAWHIGMAAALVGIPLYLWLAQPAWLFDPLSAVLPAAEVAREAAPAVAITEGSLPAPGCLPARITGDRVNLRADPGRQGKVLRKLRAGEIVTVLDCQGYELDGYTWWQVTGEDGNVGWAATQWMEEVR